MTMDLRYLAPVKVGTTNISAITNLSVSPKAKELVLRNGGEVDNSFVGATSADPVIEFTSLDLGTLLTKYSTGQVAKIDGSQNLEAYLNVADNYGTRKTGSNHEKAVVTRGLLVPMDVTANDDQPVSITNQCTIGWDGTNEAIAKALTVALPSVDMIEPFIAGGVRFNSVQLEGITSTTIQHGWNIDAKRDQGDKYPTFVHAMNRNPRVTLRMFKDRLSEYGLLGSAIEGTAVFYFRKCKQGGGLYDKSETVHISCTVYGNALPDGPSGSNDSPLEAGLKILPHKPNAGSPAITWAVGVAIP